MSVQWGPWAEVGMAARAGTTESGGYLRLDPTASLQAPSKRFRLGGFGWSALIFPFGGLPK